MDDRRQFQRLRLAKPLLATARGENVLVLDLGVAGALIEHRGSVQPGDSFPMSFRWQNGDIEMLCEVVRSHPQRGPVSHTGVRFVSATGDSTARLRELIASYVGRVIDAQKANASGGFRAANADTILEQLGHARRARTSGYVSWHFGDGAWSRTPTLSPVQPGDGFTVAAYEDDEEVASLCRTYEKADEEGRRLIRMVAELSITK